VVLLRADAPTAQSVLRRHSLTLDPAMKDEGYVSPPTVIVIVAARFGRRLLWRADGEADCERRRRPGQLYRATIRDWPAMRYRGFHDDLSRGPVPTLEFQKKQIRTLAAYKVNLFSPYFEHTLAYDSNPLIAPPGGAMTHADVKDLVAYAANYHVDIMPEQEAFGHLHHALKYEIYSPLGETAHGHVLAPGQPGSLPLIRQMFAEINTLFPSRFRVHLGGRRSSFWRGRDRRRVKTVGIGVVHPISAKQIAGRTRGQSGKKFLFWGDVALSSPSSVNTIPGKESDRRPRDETWRRYVVMSRISAPHFAT
jgi:hypothetical protein